MAEKSCARYLAKSRVKNGICCEVHMHAKQKKKLTEVSVFTKTVVNPIGEGNLFFFRVRVGRAGGSTTNVGDVSTGRSSLPENKRVRYKLQHKEIWSCRVSLRTETREKQLMLTLHPKESTCLTVAFGMVEKKDTIKKKNFVCFNQIFCCSDFFSAQSSEEIFGCTFLYCGVWPIGKRDNVNLTVLSHPLLP